MDAEIELEGTGADDRSLYAVQDWVRKEQIEGLQVTRKSTPGADGKMGGALEAILSVVLAAPAIVQLVRCLHAYVITSRPKFAVKIKAGKSEIAITGENIENLDGLLEKASVLAKVANEK